MTSGESSTKLSGGFPQRRAVATPGSPKSLHTAAWHVGGATLTLAGRDHLGRTVVPGAPGPEKVVRARRWRGRPGQQVTRVPIAATATAHGNSEGHVRAEACGPTARTRRAGGLLRPLLGARLGHLAVHGAGAVRTSGGRAELLRRDSTGALE